MVLTHVLTQICPKRALHPENLSQTPNTKKREILSIYKYITYIYMISLQFKECLSRFKIFCVRYVDAQLVVFQTAALKKEQ